MLTQGPDQQPEEQDKLPEDAGDRIGGWMIALLWVLLLGGGWWLSNQWITGREQARAPLWIESDDPNPALILKANRYGQYQIIGSANENRVLFLLDTGASEISIPISVAERLNLRKGQGYPVSTANGELTVYSTRLDEVTIGPFTMQNVRAHINPGMRGDVALLGMSFLRHFEMIQRSGELRTFSLDSVLICYAVFVSNDNIARIREP